MAQPSPKNASSSENDIVIDDMGSADTLSATDAKPKEHHSGRNTVLPRFQTSHPDHPPELQHHTLERFENIKMIGQGGSGDITLVKDHDINRLIAMKNIRVKNDSSVQTLRFVEEIKTTGQLEHPNIVPIHDVGLNADGQYYFTMKYVQGETLMSLIKKLSEGDEFYHRRYTFERRTQLFTEILYAIQFAHSKGILHRDIKPENIMIGGCGEIVVMDWGIAKKIGQKETKKTDSISEKNLQLDITSHCITKDGTLIGTPIYMSPEQIQGKNDTLDERSDIYSLCVLFYELLTLEYIFPDTRSNLKQLAQSIVYLPPAMVEELKHPHQGRVPRELAFFLRTGLKKDPKDRFQSVQAMLSILEPTTEGRLCVNCPSTFLKRSAFEYGHYLDNHRHMGVYLTILVGLLALLGTIQLVLIFIHVII